MMVASLSRRMAQAVIGICFSVSLAADPVNMNGDGVAIDGYDAVSYHLVDQARRGDSRFSTRWRDATWYFVSEDNLRKFIADPERYAPQYTGHCANGLSDGHKVPGDPEIYRIIDGRLYLFYSRWGQLQWAVDQQEQIRLAGEYWEQVRRELGYQP